MVTFCNKAINLGAQSFRCRVGGWKLESEQLKERCNLGMCPWEKRTDMRVTQMLGICELTAFEEIWVRKCLIWLSMQMQSKYVEST